jgi:tetraacyldisaccharide 4'-kinase
VDLRTIQAGGGGLVGALARAGLTVLEGAWAAAVASRSAAWALGLARARRLPVRVVSVGNLVAGGTGNTPFVAWLAGRALLAGRRPGVLSRGYGPRPPGSALSDEGTVLADLLGPGVPQVEDPDRRRGGERLLAVHRRTDLLLLDDGFQHRRLARDVDVVLLDATNPWGHGRLLPRGLLREPPAALGRAHAVVLTRTERVSADDVARLTREARAWAPSALAATARTVPRALVLADGSQRPLSNLSGRAVFAAAGIGNPAAFEAALRDLGARVVGRRFVRDHAMPSAADAARIDLEARRAGADAVLATRKDLVKWRALPVRPAGLLALDVALEVTDGEAALLALALGPPPPDRAP